MAEQKLNKADMLAQVITDKARSDTWDDLGKAVRSNYHKYQQDRREKERLWVECWSVYTGTPAAMDFQARNAKQTLGDAATVWRHRLNPGKAYELVETVNAWLQSAFFPNREWFDLEPTQPGRMEEQPVVKKYLHKLLHDAKFQSEWDKHCRQLCITGFSGIALPWRREAVPFRKNVKVEVPEYDEAGIKAGTKKETRVRTEQRLIYNAPEVEVLDCFDLYIDPDAPSLSSANVVRRLEKHRSEIARHIQSGYYKNLPLSAVPNLDEHGFPADTTRTRRDDVQNFQGLQSPRTKGDKPATSRVEVLEFWGDIMTDQAVYHDVIITMIGDVVVRCEQNPYWCGRPFVLSTYTPSPQTPYGTGLLEPVLSQIHEHTIVTNQRLDNLELSVDTMWTFIDDGTIDEAEIFTEPGKIIRVGEHDSLRPLQASQAFTVSYTETSLLETAIEKAAGAGSFISAGAGRSGDRVTAQEVQATRDAGGNRLGRVHRHLELTGLEPALECIFRQVQQFVIDDEVIRLPGQISGEYIYATVGVDELQHDYNVRAYGAGHIADKEFELQKHLDFVTVVGSNPEMAQTVDWPEVAKLLAQKFGIDDYTRFFMQAQPQAPAPEMGPDAMLQAGGGQLNPPSPGIPQPLQLDPADMAAIEQQLLAEGGQPAVDAAQAQLAVDGGQQMLEESVPSPVVAAQNL